MMMKVFFPLVLAASLYNSSDVQAQSDFSHPTPTDSARVQASAGSIPAVTLDTAKYLKLSKDVMPSKRIHLADILNTDRSRPGIILNGYQKDSSIIIPNAYRADDRIELPNAAPVER